MDLSYILNELGEERSNYYGAVAPPIVQSSNFACPTVADLRYALQHEEEVHFYSRGNNPTVRLFEKKMAALEGTEQALAFSTGIAAVSAAVLSQVKAGDHVVCVRKPYTWASNLMKRFLPRFGVEVTFVDGTDPENYRAATKPNTVLYYLESPNSFTFELQDLEAIARIAKEKNICTIIDNSFASPLFQNPAAMGIDLVVHSATKYLGGHSDVMGGVVCGSQEKITKIFHSELMTLGAVLSPNDAWLLIRGMRTLPLRMERVAQTTRQIISFLQGREEVEEIIWPFLPTHPQYDLAQKQLKNNTGQFSFKLKTESLEVVERFCNSLQHFLMAASWGGHESLIFPMAAVYKSPDMKSSLPMNLIRVYIGLEEPDYLIKDLEQAFAKMKG